MKKKVNLNERITNIRTEVVIENGCAFANIKFRNLSYGKIVAVKFVCKGYNSLDELIEVDGKESFSLICQDLIVDVRETTILKIQLPSNSIRKIELREEKICYDNGNIVDVDLPDYIEYECDIPLRNENPEEYSLIELIKEKNSKAICFPKEVTEGYICICGRLNKSSAKECCFCGQEYEGLMDKYNIEKLKRVFEARIRHEEQERLHKQEQLERERERKQIMAETKEKARKKRNKEIVITSMIAVVVLIIVLVLHDMHFKSTYGLGDEESAKWEVAIRDYNEWKQTILNANNDFFKYCNKNDATYYTYSQILSKPDLKTERNKVLSLYDSINEIEFPEKYTAIFDKIKEYQQLYYVMDIDLRQVHIFSDQYLTGLWNEKKAIGAEIERLEEYLENEYLVLGEVDLSSDLETSYTPKTFSYTFSDGCSYISDTLTESDVLEAKNIANEYCRMLLNKQSSMSSIIYDNTEYIGTWMVQFKYKVKYTNGTTRYGVVTVEKISDTWKADGMKMED